MALQRDQGELLVEPDRVVGGGLADRVDGGVDGLEAALVALGRGRCGVGEGETEGADGLADGDGGLEVGSGFDDRRV